MARTDKDGRKAQELIPVVRTEPSKTRAPAKQYTMETLANAQATSGPSNRKKEEPIPVTRSEGAKGPTAKRFDIETLAKAPGTSGPSSRPHETVKVLKSVHKGR